MKTPTFRILKAIGLITFIILFRVFIFVLSKPQNIEQKELAISADPDSQDCDVVAADNSQKRPIGFEYQKKVEDGGRDSQSWQLSHHEMNQPF
jgi:hypothetical protein